MKIFQYVLIAAIIWCVNSQIIDELDDLDDLEDIEESEDNDDVDGIEDIEGIEGINGVEDVDDIDDADDTDDIDDTNGIDSINGINGIEGVDVDGIDEIYDFQEKGDEKYNILALVPYNGKSHFDFAEVLFEELARRGHNITVVSHFPKKRPFKNYHDISMESDISDAVHNISMEEATSTLTIFELINLFKKGVDRVCREGLSHPNIQKLLESDDEYDVVITEMFNSDCFLGFVDKFKAPHVSFRTSVLSTWLVGRTGVPDNPSYIPSTTGGYPSRMKFYDRLCNTIWCMVVKLIYRGYNMIGEETARKHFGEDMPDLQAIAQNTTLYLINTHFVHQYPRPLLPNVKEVAGMHLRDAKPLSWDLENWISGSSQGLIYLNLGSMLKPSSMSEDKRKAFFEAFAWIEDYRILMKWDDDQMESVAEEVPDNVKLVSWLPQNDVLHHPKVKLFITHGGMLGTIEAVHAGVPMIIIPFFGDQLTNAVLLEERGLGTILQYNNISTESLIDKMQLILDDRRYSRRAKELSAAFRDRPVSALEEAAYWVEYVARHKGIAQDLLHSPALDLSFHEYTLLDIVVFVVSIWIVLWWGASCNLGSLFFKKDNKQVVKEDKEDPVEEEEEEEDEEEAEDEEEEEEESEEDDKKKK